MMSGSGEYEITYSTNQTAINTTERSGINVAVTVVIMAVPSTVQILFCGIILMLFYRVPRFRTASNLSVVNLVASYFVRGIVGLLVVPVVAVRKTVTPKTADDVLCMAFRYINNVQFAWASWAIAIVAYGHSDLIVNVLTPKFSRNKFWTFAVISWMVSLLTALPPLVGWSSYGFERDSVSYVCRTGVNSKGLSHAIYVPFFYVVNFLFPIVLVIISFVRVVLAAKRYARTEKLQQAMQTAIVFQAQFLPSPGAQIDEQQKKKQHWREASSKSKEILESKAFRFVCVIVMTHLLLLAPMVCLTCYDTICSNLELTVDVPKLAHHVTTLLYWFILVVNSFLFIRWIKTIQQSAIAVCFYGMCHRDTN